MHGGPSRMHGGPSRMHGGPARMHGGPSRMLEVILLLLGCPKDNITNDNKGNITEYKEIYL